MVLLSSFFWPTSNALGSEEYETLTSFKQTSVLTSYLQKCSFMFLHGTLTSRFKHMSVVYLCSPSTDPAILVLVERLPVLFF